ncbi:MAG: hypothetical protein ACD_67C00237G0003 [uncultured bacterium]|nr:MAG: hypothetical protein ACD_67C00237G0003 [uncultured bacterium]
MKIYLDLLPKQRKSEIRRKKIFRILLREEALFLLPLLLFIIILLNVYYLISVQHDISIAAHSSIESQEKYQELNLYEEKFKQVNETASLILKISDGHLHWGKVFDKMNGIIPEGIALTGFSTKNYKIFLIGNAKDRNILLNFKEKLSSDQCFEDVNVPLSNLVVKENVDFQMDFSIKQDCLRK